MPFYVVGGEYSDTTFRNLVKPAPVSGPFDDYYSAYESWRARAMETVDQAYARFHIVQTVEGAPHPGLAEEIRHSR